MELQKKITNALTAGTIDEVQSIFAKEFDLPSLDDAMEVYLKIKDILLILDQFDIDRDISKGSSDTPKEATLINDKDLETMKPLEPPRF